MACDSAARQHAVAHAAEGPHACPLRDRNPHAQLVHGGRGERTRVCACVHVHMYDLRRTHAVRAPILQRGGRTLPAQAHRAPPAQERENDLAQRAERLTAMRELAAQQASARRDASRQQDVQLRRAEQERLAEQQLEVHSKIEEKRAVRRKQEAKLAADLKAIRIKNSFLGTDREAVERKGWESQQAGAAREIRVRQGGRAAEASAKVALDHKERAQRLHNIQRERAAHEAFLRATASCAHVARNLHCRGCRRLMTCMVRGLCGSAQRSFDGASACARAECMLAREKTKGPHNRR